MNGLPGKEAGLSQSCPPEVLIHDIPNLYPYIMDDVGEGIQAKRRGRAVILDYLIPGHEKRLELLRNIGSGRFDK